MRIDKYKIKNNSFFSTGTQNATSLETSGISTEGAEVFPFATKRGPERGQEFHPKSNASGDVAGTAPVGREMKFSDLKQKVRGVHKKSPGGIGRFASRSQITKKLGVAPFED